MENVFQSKTVSSVFATQPSSQFDTNFNFNYFFIQSNKNIHIIKKGATCEIPVLRCQVANPCLNGATCTGGVGDAPIVCNCAYPYKDLTCSTKLSLCEQSECKNGATCSLISETEFKCSCPIGFSGADCSTGINYT